MNYTGHTLNQKPLPRLSLGCMRFTGRENTVETIRSCVESGILYLDTCSAYCYRSEEENSETWIGEALKGIREKVILSTKCSCGDGVSSVGEYNPSIGFSVTTADQVRRQIEQSLRRLGTDRLDCYQLWSVHNAVIFNEAFKKGGWLEGVRKARDEGLIRHIGITGHDGVEGIRRWIQSGCFDMITVPFNLFDISRLEAIRLAHKKGMAVIGMNPLAGGCLCGQNDVIDESFTDFGVDSTADLALRFCGSIRGMTVLCGMNAGGQAVENAGVFARKEWSEEEGLEARRRFISRLQKAGYNCSDCRECMPCPQELDIPGVAGLLNYYKLTGSQAVVRYFGERCNFLGNAYKANRCDGCGTCGRYCPEDVPVEAVMREAAGFMQ